MINAIIIDDEPLAHDVLLHHLQQHQKINITHQCYNALDALAWLAKKPVDLMFLDINMPQLNGFEMLKLLAKPPQVIVTSAYKEFAIEGFELNVTDYLLKPISEERLRQALSKVTQQKHTQAPETSKTTTAFFKVDRELKKFILSDIDVVEAYGNYVKVWSGDQPTLVSNTLKNMLHTLPAGEFSQVHKSFIVRNEAITAFGTASLIVNEHHEIKIGNAYKKQAATLKALILSHN